MRTIQLTKGYIARVDDSDFDWLSQWRWYADVKSACRVYARRDGWDRNTKRNVKIYMHRAVVSAPVGVSVDHIDHDGLNNSKSNLRLATGSQNNANARYTAGSSGFRGVTQRVGKTSTRYIAQIQVDRTVRYLGIFGAIEDAARAYDAAALDAFGEFAVLNFK
jgi:hypothetical protein